MSHDKDTPPVFRLRPGAQLDHSFDWRPWLAQGGDEIASYTVTVPQQLGKLSVMMDAGVVTVWLEGRTAGYRVPVRCDIATNSSPPRKDWRTILVDVRA